MKFSATHLKRYKEIALLFWKYGRSDLVRQMQFDADLPAPEGEPPAAGKATPEQLANDLEAMGPTYVKLGQVLSGRPDLLPEPYVKALTRLQDNVKPFAFSEVEQIVAEELGVRLSRAFSRFDPEPMAAASLGQVHSAALRDGRQVVVKVQRPRIVSQIADDFEVISQIAEFLDAHTELGRRHRFVTIVEEFQNTVRQELNYEREAANLRALHENLREFPHIQVPLPIADYTTRRVLTMEHVRGRKVTALGPLARLEMDGPPLAGELFKAYLKQVLVDGFFHADPHPGNVFVTDDHRIALIDLGMVGHVAPGMQEKLLKLLLAVSEGQSEQAGTIVIGMSEVSSEFREVDFRRRLGQLIAVRQNQVLQDLNVGKSLLEVSQSAADCGLRVPSELTLLGKTLLQLDEVGRILDPTFDPNAAIRANVAELMARRMQKQATAGGVLSTLLEVKEFVSALPGRVNRLMDVVSSSELEVKVRATDAPAVMDGLQKIANRITAGIVLAALIIGASMLMQAETRFRLFGYPGLAMICFLAAAAGGFWLVISIFLHDRSRSRKPPRS